MLLLVLVGVREEAVVEGERGREAGERGGVMIAVGDALLTRVWK